MCPKCPSIVPIYSDSVNLNTTGADMVDCVSINVYSCNMKSVDLIDLVIKVYLPTIIDAHISFFLMVLSSRFILEHVLNFANLVGTQKNTSLNIWL